MASWNFLTAEEHHTQAYAAGTATKRTLAFCGSKDIIGTFTQRQTILQQVVHTFS